MTVSPSHNSNRSLVLGCIADDVTGATDLAINLSLGGMRVVQLLSVPTVETLNAMDADAVVVGLKTRAAPKADAVAQSLACLKVFRDAGVERCYFKYCSTFDSTSDGNIGPVAGALLDALALPQTIFCPAFPANGRTVYQGHLFVHGRLLHESGMEHHPLNPMTDANLVRVLEEQSDRKVGLIRFEDVDNHSVEERLQELASDGCPFAITDACHDKHLETIARVATELPLVTGGSALGKFLAFAYRDAGLLRSKRQLPRTPNIPGRSLIISGSCADATRKQVAWMKSRLPSWQLTADLAVAGPTEAAAQAIDWVRDTVTNDPIMIYATASPQDVAEGQQRHGAQVAQDIESALAEIAATLITEFGFTRLVIAGGETAGAVVGRLGICALEIGSEICPGVPWTQSIGQRSIALALKSGNFGDEEFFAESLEMLP